MAEPATSKVAIRIFDKNEMARYQERLRLQNLYQAEFEAAKFQTKRKIRPLSWTKSDLLVDFKKQLKDENMSLKCMGASALVGWLANKAQAVGQPAETLMATLTAVAKTQVQGLAAGEVIGYAAEDITDSKADQKFIKSVGTQFVVVGVKVALGGVAPAGTAAAIMFSIILYLYEKDQERTAAANEALATKIWDNFERIRQDAQFNLDNQDRSDFLSMIKSDASVAADDYTPFGSYQIDGEPEVTFTRAQMGEARFAIWTRYEPFTTNDDLLRVLSTLGVKPKRKDQLELTEAQKDQMKDILKDIQDSSFGSEVDEGVGDGITGPAQFTVRPPSIALGA